jgi:hypothetical protein
MKYYKRYSAITVDQLLLSTQLYTRHFMTIFFALSQTLLI